uniref:Ribosomal protein S13 n=1 Tax=Moramonas marocensis TaxID=1805496 RepID=A0A140F2H0_9EUKA|nr:ribosomal protein S13 [Moramonas marocensis]
MLTRNINTHLFGVNIAGQGNQGEKSIYIALSILYGLGHQKSIDICSSLGIHYLLPLRDLSDIQMTRISNFIEDQYTIESQLRKIQQNNIKRFISIRSYRGMRHLYGLPVHGQRTHTNAKTQKKLSNAMKTRLSH